MKTESMVDAGLVSGLVIGFVVLTAAAVVIVGLGTWLYFRRKTKRFKTTAGKDTCYTCYIP